MKTHFSLIAIIFFVSIGCSKKHETKSENNVTENLKKEDSSHELDFIDQATFDFKYSTEQLDNTNGLSNSSVNTIFQDSKNLLNATSGFPSTDNIGFFNVEVIS